MTFVSYAQNFEDVMLWRALKHVERGFYIDVGAAWPDEHSVTKALYDMGWNGINIEPNPLHYRKLKAQRTRDINLRVAVGSQDGELTMNFVEDSGLSTVDDDIAARHQQSGWEVVREQVPVVTLRTIWHQYVPLGQEVHFLKVDVEGFEKAVIEGNDWRKCRPWVVVVEATLPMLPEMSYQSWEPMLLNVGYLFAYADGLNRFYLAQEHEALLPGFKYPPNVFDDFKLAAQLNPEERLVPSEVENRAQVSEVHGLRQFAEARMAQVEAECRAKIAEERFRLQVAESRAQEAAERVVRAENRGYEAEVRAAEAVAKQRALQAKVEQLNDQSHHRWLQASQLESERNALLKSWSWRVTAPLRFSAVLLIHPGAALRKNVNHVVHCTVEACQRPLSRLMSAVLRRPKLAHHIHRLLMRYPALYQQLLGVARRQGVVPGVPNYGVPVVAVTEKSSESALADLPPRARQIYADLKVAIEKHKGPADAYRD